MMKKILCGNFGKSFVSFVTCEGFKKLNLHSPKRRVYFQLFENLIRANQFQIELETVWLPIQIFALNGSLIEYMFVQQSTLRIFAAFVFNPYMLLPKTLLFFHSTAFVYYQHWFNWKISRNDERPLEFKNRRWVYISIIPRHESTFCLVFDNTLALWTFFFFFFFFFFISLFVDFLF